MPPKIGSLGGPSSASTYYWFFIIFYPFFPAYSSHFHGNLQIAIYIPQKIWNTSDFEGGEFKSPDFEKKTWLAPIDS
jgi:hypothetical protein